MTVATGFPDQYTGAVQRFVVKARGVCGIAQDERPEDGGTSKTESHRDPNPHGCSDLMGIGLLPTLERIG